MTRPLTLARAARSLATSTMMLLALAATASAAAPAPEDPNYAEALDRILARTLGPEHAPGHRPYGNRALFEQVLSSDSFLSAEVGPFDLYVYMAGDLAPGHEPPFDWARDFRQKNRTKLKSDKTLYAQHVFDLARSGLGQLVPVLDRYFTNESGLISGQRFPLVVCSDDGGDSGAFDELTALLDWCERDWTDFVRVNGSLWTADLRDGIVVRNWDAQVVNIAHPNIIDRGEEFLEHGLGYYTLAHLVRKLIVFGSYGNPPPWFSDGLVDELDIQAHGKAWVGGDWFTQQTPGWFRPGWSGFLPTGTRPPPVVRGPPADLGTTVSKSGDVWAHRANSPMRHWENLAEDLKSESPASFSFMAENESFLPRDRALARCALHLILDLAAPDQQPSLLTLMDRPSATPENGMPDNRPITMLFAECMGGVEAVEELEGLSSGELLERLGQGDVARPLFDLEAEALLDLSDHREQAQWLFEQYDYDDAQRAAVWNVILTIEYHQQLAEWQAIGEALDKAVGAALSASKGYPSSSSKRKKVSAAFRGQLEAS